MSFQDELNQVTQTPEDIKSQKDKQSYTYGVNEAYRAHQEIKKALLECAKEGKYDEAAELIKQGDEAFSLGHNAHADLLTMDANGEISNGYMLLMHAEDQLMSAEGFRILADEFIALYKRIDEK